MSTTDYASVEHHMQRIDQLVQEIERSADPVAQTAAREMVAAVLGLHAAGLAKIIGSLSEAGDRGRALLAAWSSDELVCSLLLLHGLHPESLAARVGQALDKVRPYLHSHGGDVELLEVIDGTVRLRMQGSCHGCPSSSATLKLTIEQAIYETAPDIAAIEVEGLVQEPVPANLVQLGMPQ